MADLKERIRTLAADMQLSALATVTEDGLPWVRYVMARADDELVFRCATRVNARKVAQVERDPEVHLTCGATDPLNANAYLQVQGRARIATDAAEKESFWVPMLERVFRDPTDPDYAVIVIEPYRIEYWQAAAGRPEVWETQ